MRATTLAGLAALALLAGCTRHTVRLEPIEIKPIHITMDINIKIDRELDQFFDFEEEAAPQPQEGEKK